MNTNINIRLKPATMRRLEQRSKILKTNTDALINKALDDYFYIERLDELRSEVKNKAQEQGFLDEEAIFNSVS